MLTGQPGLGSPSVRIPTKATLECIKLTIKINHPSFFDTLNSYPCQGVDESSELKVWVLRAGMHTILGSHRTVIRLVPVSLDRASHFIHTQPFWKPESKISHQFRTHRFWSPRVNLRGDITPIQWMPWRFPEWCTTFWDKDEIIQVIHASQIRTENQCFSPREEVTMGKIIKDYLALGMNMELQHPLGRSEAGLSKSFTPLRHTWGGGREDSCQPTSLKFQVHLDIYFMWRATQSSFKTFVLENHVIESQNKNGCKMPNLTF